MSMDQGPNEMTWDFYLFRIQPRKGSSKVHEKKVSSVCFIAGREVYTEVGGVFKWAPSFHKWEFWEPPLPHGALPHLPGFLALWSSSAATFLSCVSLYIEVDGHVCWDVASRCSSVCLPSGSTVACLHQVWSKSPRVRDGQVWRVLTLWSVESRFFPPLRANYGAHGGWQGIQSSCLVLLGLLSPSQRVDLKLVVILCTWFT